MKREVKTKKDVVIEVSSRMGGQYSDVALILNEMLNVIKDFGMEGCDVSFRGFGSFNVVRRKARKARIITENREISIPAKDVIKFKPSYNVGATE